MLDADVSPSRAYTTRMDFYSALAGEDVVDGVHTRTWSSKALDSHITIAVIDMYRKTSSVDRSLGWVSDWLTQILPEARRKHYRSEFLLAAENIEQQAEILLHRLAQFEEALGDDQDHYNGLLPNCESYQRTLPSRSLLFVCQGLGGLVVKQVLAVYILHK